jgi:hypothetical protein
MSRNASIEFKFQSVEDVKAVLDVLMADVFEFKDSYFVNDEDDMFDWIRSEGGSERALSAIAEAWRAGVTSGVLVTLAESERGGELIFFPDRSVVSFSASLQRKIITGSEKFTDFGWYCGKMVPPLERVGLAEINCSDFA